MTLRVTGGPEFTRLAADLRREKAASRRAILQAIERGALVLRKTIPASAAAKLPGDYGPTIGRAVRLSPSVQLGRGTVVIRVHAMGRGEQRDVNAVDMGTLRHPLYGNRGHWFDTRVPPGFVSQPFEAARGPITDEVDEVLNGIVDRIEKG